MALGIMILRKILKNKWLELGLLFGLVFTVALVSSMPIYTQAILQRMLDKELQNLQLTQNVYPGTLSYAGSQLNSLTLQKNKEIFMKTDQMFKQEASQFGMPVQLEKVTRVSENGSLKLIGPDKKGIAQRFAANIMAESGLEQHIHLIDGRMPAVKPVNGVYEVLVTDNFLTTYNTVLGAEYTLSNYTFDSSEKMMVVHLKIVGVMEQKDNQDVYWDNTLDEYKNSFFVNYDLFSHYFADGTVFPLTSSIWYGALDYTKLKLSHIQTFMNSYHKVDRYFAETYQVDTNVVPAVDVLNSYFVKEKQLRTLLFSINVPVITLLAFYLYMVANLITERQKTEIAVLRSRGASRLQILFGYLLEGILLGGLAFIIGPVAGLQITRMLGASNGFLEFVERASLDAHLSMQTFEYAVAAVVCSVIMTLIPAFRATRISIVDHKRKSARIVSQTFWHKFLLDFLLSGLAIYELITFRGKMHDLSALGLNSADFHIDPLLFIIPSIYILGFGLLALRLYPWFVKLVYWVGKRWWPSTVYMILLQVGRSATKYQFIMLFLILTLSTGLFSASAARTINQNSMDKISYSNGADIVLQVKWPSNSSAPQENSSGPGPSSAAANSSSSAEDAGYVEPPYSPYKQLPGVEYAAKVFIKENALVQGSGDTNESTELMGIDTDDFGHVAWTRNQLLAHPMNDYLNLIAGSPSAVLISQSLADQLDVKVGDQITVGWADLSSVPVIVYGIINAWPSWNPNPIPMAEGSSRVIVPNLIVGHLDYIQNNLNLEPYKVWLKLKPGASSNAIYQAVNDQKLPVIGITDTMQQLIIAKNDPFQMAINGVMSLGFVISILVSLLGYLLYWILSLADRTLQFGILRAMGSSFKQLLGLLCLEQLLTSGAAIGIGLMTGETVSKWFVPLFQLSFNTSTQVPSFKVFIDPRDNFQIYVILAFMLVVGLAILGIMLSKIKISQAVKLGED